MSLKRSRSFESSSKTSADLDVFKSSSIEDRSSTFVGFYSPTIKPKELQNIAEIKSASHKIVAWRRESNQQSINKSKQYVTGSDDDGEKYGGKKIERVLVAAQVEGSCVVARWYGGVMLGPVRFDHIEACARQAVAKWQERQGEETRKRQKIELDESERAHLAITLTERDQSIDVLRKLATDKEDSLKQIKAGHDASSGDGSITSRTEATEKLPASNIDYSAMPLQRLRALERARDATLAFLLKRIDKAEAEIMDTKEQLLDPP